MKSQRSRPYRSPDGLDWRDPELPVFGKSGTSIEHWKLSALARFRIERSPEPSYRQDQTYNLRRKPK